MRFKKFIILCVLYLGVLLGIYFYVQPTIYLTGDGGKDGVSVLWVVGIFGLYGIKMIVYKKAGEFFGREFLPGVSPGEHVRMLGYILLFASFVFYLLLMFVGR